MIRTRGWFIRRLRGDDIRNEVTDEIGFHVEALTEQFMRNGMNENDARRAALERFGDSARVAGTMRALARKRERSQRAASWLRGIERDLRYAFRQAIKRPVFTCVALVTLALGIGANTAIFSAVNHVLLRPLPVRGLDRVVFLRGSMPKLGLIDNPLDPSETLALTKRADLFSAIAGTQMGAPVLVSDDEPQRLSIARTMGTFFDVFGVKPYLGTFYRAEDSENGNHLVAVLSYDFWRQRGADSSIIGKSLTLSSGTYLVLGVMQPDFRYPRSPQFWSPLRITPEMRENHGRLGTETVARIRDGVSLQTLAHELDLIAADLHKGSTKADYYLSSAGFIPVFAGDLQPALIVLLVAVGFVLLVACANIASLQLVHGAARVRELAVRAALGAGRAAIMRQLIVENLTLAVAGGLIGIGVGVGALRLLAALGASQLPALDDVHIDIRVLGFTAFATMACAVGVGLIPALKGGKVDMNEALKEGARSSGGASRNRLLNGAVVVQMALAMVLVLGSTLMIRSFGQLLAQDPGFRAEKVYTMRFVVTGPRARSPQITSLYDELMERLRRAQGISAAGMISELPFSGASNSSPFRIRGRADDPNGPALHANLRVVGGDYFKAMGIPLLRGRLFDATDIKGNDPGVALIDETLAKTYFGNEDPIGRTINQGPDAVIIGIVGAVHHGDLEEPVKSTFYYPYAQKDWYSSLYLTVKSALPAATVQNIVRTELKAVDPGVPLFEFRSLEERIDASLAPRRLAMTVLSALGALSLGLAMFGMYGVISYAVAQRRKEFGIRVALGATPGVVRTMVLRQALRLGVLGVVIGLGAAFFATRALSRLVFGVSTHDPASFASAAALLAAVALFAAYVPARRATAVSPLETLR